MINQIALEYVKEFYNKVNTEDSHLDFFTYEDWDNCCLEDKLADDGYVYGFGASKLVVLNKVIDDKVIKIPFKTNSDYDYEYNMPDHCAREAEMYELADEAGFGDILAKTECCGYIGGSIGSKIYLSDRIEDNESFDALSVIPENEVEYAEFVVKTIAGSYDYISGDVMAKFIRDYGEERAIAFLDFTKEHCINDIRQGNVGIRDGKVVVFDYSGYISGSYSCNSYNNEYESCRYSSSRSEEEEM